MTLEHSTDMHQMLKKYLPLLMARPTKQNILLTVHVSAIIYDLIHTKIQTLNINLHNLKLTHFIPVAM